MAQNPHRDSVAYSPIATQHNFGIINYCRASVAAISGCTAGILGLTGLLGFLFYVVAQGFLSLLMLKKAGPSWHKYFLQRSSLTYSGILGEITTFVPAYLIFTAFRINKEWMQAEKKILQRGRVKANHRRSVKI